MPTAQNGTFGFSRHTSQRSKILWPVIGRGCHEHLLVRILDPLGVDLAHAHKLREDTKHNLKTPPDPCSSAHNSYCKRRFERINSPSLTGPSVCDTGSRQEQTRSAESWWTALPDSLFCLAYLQGTKQLPSVPLPTFGLSTALCNRHNGQTQLIF